MKIVYIITGVLLALLGPGQAKAQSTPATPVLITAKAEFDSFFGFYPSLNLSHSLDSVHLLTAYGTCYTQPGSVGVETGAGLVLSFPQRRLTLTPSVGVLSGSFFGPARGFLVGEGYTASLAVQKEWPHLSVTGLLGYYGLLRQKTPDVYDIAFYHIDAGYNFSSRLTLGILHEQILAVRLPHNDGDNNSFQLVRVGIFGRAPLPGGVQAELAGGWLHGGFVRASLSRTLIPSLPAKLPAP